MVDIKEHALVYIVDVEQKKRTDEIMKTLQKGNVDETS